MSVDTSTGIVTWTGGTSSTGSIAAEFAELALAYAKSNNIEATAVKTATTTSLVFENLEYGYYLIDSSLGTLCSLDSTDPDVTVKDKNVAPTVEKEVMEDSTGDYGDSNTADVGEVVYYKTEISGAADMSNLVLHDTLSEGLTLNYKDDDGNITTDAEDSAGNANTPDITISIGSSQSTDATTVDASDYTITINTSDGCTFEIRFDDEFLADLTSSQIIIVTYTATVNTNAVIGTDDGNSNSTYVSYGDASKSTSDKTVTYVYDIYIYKYTEKDVNGTTTEFALSDATFILYRTVGGTKYYAVINDAGTVTGWTTYQTKDDIENAYTNGDITSDEYAAATYATEVTSGTDGLIHISGLDAGSYYLEETEAPDGYTLLATAVSFTIAQEGTYTGTAEVTVNNETYDAVKIKNGSGSEMPSTGGIGTTIFYVIGGILVVGACVILITRRRMGRAE
ncbi:MAG: LPXTG cell wall anchor domain-containing protein [Clostridiales bacterium]|nr:LPXTG cell wall anchor domain-containing protein [Clostridiales bacterium]